MSLSDYRDLLKNCYTLRELDVPLHSYKMVELKFSLEKCKELLVLNKELHLPNHSIPLAKGLLNQKGRSVHISGSRSGRGPRRGGDLHRGNRNDRLRDLHHDDGVLRGGRTLHLPGTQVYLQ